MPGELAGQGFGSMVTEPGLAGAAGQWGPWIEPSGSAGLHAAFRHDEAATARVARRSS